MIKRTLAQVHEMAGGLNDISAFQSVEVTGVSIDSRSIGAGNLFIPFKGENVDGHQYVERAISQGAAASLWQKDVPNPPAGQPIILVENTLQALQQLAKNYRDQLSLKIVGITGSNGKTTTKDMTASLLGTTYKVHKTNGNFNNHIGLPLTMLGMDEETEIAVLEMGMSGRGEIELLSKLARPNVVIITNIGEAHLLDLGSREGIAQAKLEIISGLQAGGTVIYHGDEPLLRDKLESSVEERHFQTISFGKGENNDIYPVNIQTGQDHTVFSLNDNKEEFTISVLGTHNVLNAIAAIAAARTLDVEETKLQDGLNNIQLTSMRMEMVEGLNGEKIINDAYNASPTSMKAAIDLVGELTGFGNKIAVLADMLELGPEEEQFHYKLGEEINPAQINKVFTFGRLGRLIAEGAKNHFSAENVFAFNDKGELVEELKKHVSSGDLVLVKGSRGMKLEEVAHKLSSQS
ncbi:UDP-N-acetylmuramoyl-tripeptide--D-alanyl-D-alanine ligase [Peribacillus saganii]|uniref:UDP-N-acetylmuramoyl-tripeptide--D-alanyl-D-alanine ligase n=1 Tax=Peribacillus saganii TaxID=2303992 RepID=A0A372LLZ4_9BACI|nr:UDP-N-acetylmuramoyl-tripeptide--D-alanyl-D-alanine ligase [Peribacillus saganii]RFU67394.1 UDP-N-acetylmuramoyl-tripeptide--D-alanyl-D-alanine ligase [Peribacillus saganii]